MFYEEQMIHGVLCFRNAPNGAWKVAQGAVADAANALYRLTDDQRIEVARWFCGNCGATQRDGRLCQCWNDE